MDGPQLPPGDDYFERAIKALGRKDPELSAYAAEIFLRLAEQPGIAHQIVPALVRAACGKGTRVDHRIRILDVIQRIGRPLNPNSFMDLTCLARLSGERVAEKVSEVIAVLRPSQPAAQMACP